MKKSFSMIIGALLLGFTACEDVPAPYGINWDGVEEEEVIVLPAGTGTIEDPFNVAGILQYTSKLESDQSSPNKVYFKGYITSFKSGEEPGNSYGNATFYIADTPNGTNTFYVYRAMSYKGAKFTANEIEVGDEVVLYGTVTNYKGNTPETVQKECELISVKKGEGGNGGSNNGNTNTPDAGDKGTKENPFSVASIIEFTSKLAAGQETTGSYYIKGFVTSFKSGEEPGNSFGNATYYIADTKGGEPTFMVYRGMYFGGQKFTSADQLKVGDEVIIYSPVVNFKGDTPETVSGKAQIYSLNGKVEEVGGGDNPGPGPQTGEGLTISREGSTVTITDSKATAGTATVDFDFGTLGNSQDNATDVVEVTLSDGTTITFDKADNANQPKYYTGTKGVRVYGGNSIVITGKKKIASITWTCDTTYTGADSMVATVDGNVVTIQNGATGATQFRVQTIHIVYAN